MREGLGKAGRAKEETLLCHQRSFSLSNKGGSEGRTGEGREGERGDPSVSSKIS